MRRHPWITTLGIVPAAVCAACITVNIYFPAPEVRRAAENIVDETWGPGASAHGTDAESAATPAPVPSTAAWRRPLEPASAWAAEPDLKVSTAAIRKLKAAMAERATKLKPSMRAGHVGIGGDGMLLVRSVNGVSLRDQASVRRLVAAENRDRTALYREIAKANDFGGDRVGDIQRIFAETWIAKAETGWWVHKGGVWSQR